MSNHRKYGRPQGISEVLERYLQKLGRPEQAMLTRLWQHWSVVMGPELTALAWPLGAKGSTLLIGGEDAMSVQELSYMTDEILERVNAFMGKEHFTHVKARLSLDKTPLDVTTLSIPTAPPLLPPGPPLSGEYLAEMDPESAVARCYARYVETKAKKS